jgi:hypothetical protein
VSAGAVPDADSYIERQCPSTACRFIFKVHRDDWRVFFRDEAVYCPRCRHSGKGDQWWTEKQKNQAIERGAPQFLSGIDRAMRQDARIFNAQQPRNSFINLRMSVWGSGISPFYLPLQVSELWKVRIECEECHARFAVIGAAYFCPCCGHDAVERAFDTTMDRISKGMGSLDVIRGAFAELGSKDEAELIIQQLVESSIEDCVTALQRLLDTLYARHTGHPPEARNVFQRIDDGSNSWRQAVGIGYEEFLDSRELSRLRLFVEQRHLLSHTDGIVDGSYLKKTGDKTYTVGQRVVISPNDVLEMASLVRRVADGIRRSLAAVEATRSPT